MFSTVYFIHGPIIKRSLIDDESKKIIVNDVIFFFCHQPANNTYQCIMVIVAEKDGSVFEHIVSRKELLQSLAR